MSASTSHKVDGSVSGVNPVARAGADQVVKSEAAVTLTGSGIDPNSGQTATLTYAWTQMAPATGNNSNLLPAARNTASVSFTAPTIAANGNDITLTFRLTVTDSDMNTGSDTVDVIVTREATVSSVTISSTPPGVVANTYVQGETIEVSVAFSEAVTVTGTPQLTITGGNSATYTADYDSDASSGSTLAFTYTVQSADTAANGISIAADALSLNGGTIKDASGLAADLTHDAVAANNSHKVDGSVSGMNPVAEAGDDQVVKSGAGVTLTGSATDPNSDALTYAWTQTAPTTGNGANLLSSVATNAATLSFTAPTIAAGGADITLTFRADRKGHRRQHRLGHRRCHRNPRGHGEQREHQLHGGSHPRQHLCPGRIDHGVGAVQRNRHGGHRRRNAASAPDHRQRHPATPLTPRAAAARL